MNCLPFQVSDVIAPAIRLVVVITISDGPAAPRITASPVAFGSAVIAIIITTIAGMFMPRTYHTSTILPVTPPCWSSSCARRAAYSAQDLASLPTEWRQKYLIPVGSLNCLTPRLRERTIWRVENIFDRPASEKFDVVLCRNVSIYMTPATSMRLWRLLDESLRPGGLLVVGRAERPCRQLHYERVGECVFAKKEGHR